MTKLSEQGNHLAKHGLELLEQGYSIVPIQPGKKAPGFDGWQKAKANKAQLQEWLEDGHHKAGVGIITRETCAVDIDCMDREAAEKFEAMCLDILGPAPIRIGKAPKRLLLYRTETPFRKMRSTVFFDEWQDKQMIEVLGDGQQFVAFHVHPETGKDYVWIDDKSPLNIRAADLTEIKEEDLDRLLVAFDEYGVKEGWEVRKGKTAKAVAVDTENPWVEDSAPITISVEELRSRLMLIPDVEDHDTWFQVGMALYHQFDGDGIGFDLWNEWSETAFNYDRDACQRRWPTFGIEGKKRAPLTARYILRQAHEAVQKTNVELSVKLRDAFLKAATLQEWEKARQMAREAEIDSLNRSTLAVVAKDRRDSITGMKTSLVEIKRAIAFTPKKSEKLPGWCENWVYDTSDDKFFHLERKISTTQQGFNASYDRQALTKKDILDGKNSPSHTASTLALNVHQIPVVDGRRYMPGRDQIFTEPDGRFANTYAEHELPAAPEKSLPRDIRNIERVKAHIRHLLPDETKGRMLLDWLSWIVQNPGRHVNYSLMLQGVEGDGKSFFAELMRAVMGVSNVTMLNAHILHSDFTNWAEGQCLACLEEVRLINDKNKYEAINRIKPFISNNVIEIHPKGKAPYNCINTTSYLLFTNFQDALPIDDNSRRYLVLFSQWQQREKILAFKEAHPDYYTKLYGTLVESAGALRQWLLNHEQDEDFNPMGDAPDTAERRAMVNKAKPEFIQVLDNLIRDDETVEASVDLLDVTALADVFIGMGLDWPSPKTLVAMLSRDGYEELGRVKFGEDYHRFWSKEPDLFKSLGGEVWMLDSEKVRKYMRKRRESLDDEL